jgi:RNA polymerase sigma-70 factor (ECF subfamily)
MNQNDDDQKLITSVVNGDMTSFRTLVMRYEGSIAGIVKSMLGETPEAVDVGQEVFIRFYEAIKNFRGNSGLGTYLGRIAINLSLNELKRRKRKNLMFESLDAASGVPADNAGEDDMQLVYQKIELLEPEFRAVITLRIIEGYTCEETAAMLCVPVGTVLSRLHRAQKKLRSAFLKPNKL